MRRAPFNLHVPSSPGEGEPQSCEDLTEKWVEVSGEFVGTVKVQGFLAHAWADFADAVGGNVTLVELLPPFTMVRVDTSGVSSGTPVAALVGRDARTV